MTGWYASFLLSGLPPDHCHSVEDAISDIFPKERSHDLLYWGPIDYGATFAFRLNLCNPAALLFWRKVLRDRILEAAPFGTIIELGLPHDYDQLVVLAVLQHHGSSISVEALRDVLGRPPLPLLNEWLTVLESGAIATRGEASHVCLKPITPQATDALTLLCRRVSGASRECPSLPYFSTPDSLNEAMCIDGQLATPADRGHHLPSHQLESIVEALLESLLEHATCVPAPVVQQSIAQTSSPQAARGFKHLVERSPTIVQKAFADMRLPLLIDRSAAGTMQICRKGTVSAAIRQRLEASRPSFIRSISDSISQQLMLT